MRKIRDVLRLSAAGLSKRQIAASLGIGPTAAGACLRRAREAGVGWPLPDDVDDDALERRLYPPVATPAPDWRSLVVSDPRTTVALGIGFRLTGGG